MSDIRAKPPSARGRHAGRRIPKASHGESFRPEVVKITGGGASPALARWRRLGDVRSFGAPEASKGSGGRIEAKPTQHYVNFDAKTQLPSEYPVLRRLSSKVYRCRRRSSCRAPCACPHPATSTTGAGP